MKIQQLMSRSAEIITGLLFTVFFIIPPLIFIPARWNDHWIFVNYKEPKLAAISILFWAFASLFFVLLFNKYKRSLWYVTKDNSLWLLIGLSVYSLLSALWALVPEAALYEAWQWITLTMMFWIFSCLFHIEKWRNLALWSIYTTFFIVTIIGLIQTKIDIPILIAIVGTKWNSTFGAKNPCFLSLASQYFLLMFALFKAVQKKNYILSATVILIFIMESIYLLISHSRTAYAAVFVSIIVLFLLAAVLSRDKKIVLGSIVLTLVLSFFIILSVRHTFPKKWNSTVYRINHRMIPLLLHLHRYFFETARGRAILDTLQMAKEHPFGVGAGNWGFAYPLYHKHMLKKAFKKTVQIRRAHNDYVQYLGELGIPGFVFLMGLIFLQFKKLWKVIKTKLICKSERIFAVLLTSQFIAICIMLFFTFYLEYPYRKFLFVFLLTLIYSVAHNNWRVKQEN